MSVSDMHLRILSNILWGLSVILNLLVLLASRRIYRMLKEIIAMRFNAYEAMRKQFEEPLNVRTEEKDHG